MTVGNGGTIVRPADPILSGYVLENWYSDSGLSTVYNFNTLVTGNITLYAKWTTPTFTSIDAFGTWLDAQPTNTAVAPYTVALNVGDLGGDYLTIGSVGYVLRANSTKYVSLDLSGSTITSMERAVFGDLIGGLTSLTSVTIPNSVTSIGTGAFQSCSSLGSVTFEGTITAANFGSSSFYYSDDLLEKYLAEGPGTYTLAFGATTWTKQL